MTEHNFGSAYEQLEDDELLALESERGQLVAEAKAALDHELRSRKLKPREQKSGGVSRDLKKQSTRCKTMTRTASFAKESTSWADIDTHSRWGRLSWFWFWAEGARKTLL
jgi:hypothetical protein